MGTAVRGKFPSSYSRKLHLPPTCLGGWVADYKPGTFCPQTIFFKKWVKSISYCRIAPNGQKYINDLSGKVLLCDTWEGGVAEERMAGTPSFRCPPDCGLDLGTTQWAG